jgi:hypothetical protein
MYSIKQKIKSHINDVKNDPYRQGIYVGGAAGLVGGLLGLKLANAQLVSKDALIVSQSIVDYATLSGQTLATRHGDSIVSVMATPILSK